MTTSERELLEEARNPNRKGLWIHTYKGHKFYAYDPHPDDIDIEDIAHALSLTCRYSGHCKHFYSVAQHCLLIAELAPKEYKLEALLHDAAEAYLTDIPRPIKYMLNGTDNRFSKLENKINAVIARKYGALEKLPEEIKELDYNIVADEALALFDPTPDWSKWYESLGVPAWKFVQINQHTVEDQYLYLFYKYQNEAKE